MVRSVAELVIIRTGPLAELSGPDFELDELRSVAPEGAVDEGVSIVGLEGDAASPVVGGLSMAGVVMGEVETRCSSIRGRAGDCREGIIVPPRSALLLTDSAEESTTGNTAS